MELTEDMAREVASWYQSPGAIGHVLASFASAGFAYFTPAEVLEDIEATRAQFDRNNTWTDQARCELDELAAFLAARIEPVKNSSLALAAEALREWRKVADDEYATEDDERRAANDLAEAIAGILGEER